MKIGTLSRASKFSFAIATLAALLISSSVTFAGANTPRAVSPPQSGFNILPNPPAHGGGGGNNIDAQKAWNNTGTDFNTAASWTGGVPSGANVAFFNAVEVTQPNLSASLSTSGVFFSGAGSSGYDLTDTNSAVLTLTGQSTSGSAGVADASAAAIRNEITSGTNTIDVPLVLASTTGSSTFVQTGAGTLVVNGPISGNALSLRGGAGVIQLNGANSFTAASIDTAGETVVIGNDSALGAGTFTNNSTSTIQAGGGARTLANNVVLAGNMTISGSNPFTFNGTFTSSGSNSRTLTVSNAGGTTTLAGNVFLSDSNTTARSLTITGSSPVTISGVIANNAVGNTFASFLKYSGTSTLTLSNTNTYSGGTQLTVAGGAIVATADGAFGTGNISLTAASVTLTLQGGATNNYIADTANLSILTGQVINLFFAGVDTIGSLIVDNVAVAPGLYGAGPGGTNADNDFTGAGLLLVTTQVPERSTWSMLVMGAALLLGVQRWRRRRTS